MKKVLVLAMAAFLVSGVAFAHEGKDGKKCDKECCKKGAKDCCSKDKKEASKTEKPAAAKTSTAKPAAKA